MGTTIRSKLSPNNEYWIERHRYYELKHFCLQYPVWKKLRLSYDGFANHTIASQPSTTGEYGNPTERFAISRSYYSERIDMLERVARETDELFGTYILIGVTEGVSYDIIKARLGIPCGKDMYYKFYRRFFWLLDKERG